MDKGDGSEISRMRRKLCLNRNALCLAQISVQVALRVESSSYTINDTTPPLVELDPQKTRTNSNVRAGFGVVEMRRLELLTPYMRNKVLPSARVVSISGYGRILWRRRRR